MREKVQSKNKSGIYLIMCLVCVMLMLLIWHFISQDNRIKGIQVQDGDYASAIENANIGDIFVLGTCNQDYNEENGDEPIYWRVLDKNEDGIFLISEYVLSKGYDIDKCFTDSERRHIAWVDVENPDNSLFGTDGGINTKERFFSLSVDEVNKYFSGDMEIRRATTYDNANNTKENDKENINYSSWWLRTPGEDERKTTYVNEYGSISMIGKTGKSVDTRPAMWLMEEEQIDIHGAKRLKYSEITDATEGEFVLLGHYQQDKDLNADEPIEWFVLARENDKILLISRYILEKKRFGNTADWKDSELRSWLNNEFYTSAFSSDEQTKIQRIVTSNETSDLVFCLSSEEARGLFGLDIERVGHITEYLRKQNFKDYKGQGMGEWWTRSVGGITFGGESSVVIVDNMTGKVLSTGKNPDVSGINSYDVGVRPVVCISLSGDTSEAMNMSVFGFESNQDLDNEMIPKSSKNSSSGKCPNCGGSGVTKYYYGGSDLEAYFSGHDSYELGVCPMCKGTGK